MWYGFGGRGFGRGFGSRGRGWPYGAFVFEVDGMERPDGGRGRRMFQRDELKLVLLKLIADEPRHGYDLIREIEGMTGGAYAPSPGVVYPMLTLLDDMNHIAEQASEGAKKRYAITLEGQALLDENRERVEALMARLSELGARRRGGEAMPIRRAMQNLKVALQHRIQRGDFSEDTLHDVAALIDEVAQKIERLR
ncbi:PadR family transcriptional regulator [Sphingomonas lenta]|uniref:PadR family transcriptional regulator n=1 Tax=Sphingomonas lenta TaxID=1141887 RepID=A0A2A2SH03_9SPHN|nr:PadR family transcriptional regulator [Sphingomonas lenta]PAX08519.1 PadR family transcriptional regulator [Sphingomonas lenta]